ncbi:MAG: alkyl sulfatase dimerization domain-containing protein, partial [Acidimicrobiia bacterium]
LAEWAVQAGPDLASAHDARVAVNRARAKAEASTMAKGVFSWAVSESRDRRDPDAAESRG